MEVITLAHLSVAKDLLCGPACAPGCHITSCLKYCGWPWLPPLQEITDRNMVKGATGLPITTQQEITVQISKIWNTMMRGKERERTRERESAWTLSTQTHLSRFISFIAALLLFFTHSRHSKYSDVAEYGSSLFFKWIKTIFRRTVPWWSQFKRYNVYQRCRIRLYLVHPWVSHWILGQKVDRLSSLGSCPGFFIPESVLNLSSYLANKKPLVLFISQKILYIIIGVWRGKKWSHQKKKNTRGWKVLSICSFLAVVEGKDAQWGLMARVKGVRSEKEKALT